MRLQNRSRLLGHLERLIYVGVKEKLSRLHKVGLDGVTREKKPRLTKTLRKVRRWDRYTRKPRVLEYLKDQKLYLVGQLKKEDGNTERLDITLGGRATIKKTRTASEKEIKQLKDVLGLKIG